MFKLHVVLLGALLIGAAACATNQEYGDSAQPPQITFLQVKATPDSYKGQTVTWGGEVLSARRLKEGTRIEILQLPLASSLRPTMELNKDRKSTRLNSSHVKRSRMPSSA